MSYTMTRTVFTMLAVLGLALGLVAMTSSRADAYVLNGCRWSSATITWMDNAISTSHKPAAQSASSRWSSSTDVNLSWSTAYKALKVGDYSMGNNGYDGWTTWSCPGGTYINANADLNNTYTNAFSTDKRTAIYVHELGHALGLAHSNSLAVMMYHSPAHVYNTYGFISPRTDDRSGMNAVY